MTHMEHEQLYRGREFEREEWRLVYTDEHANYHRVLSFTGWRATAAGWVMRTFPRFANWLNAQLGKRVVPWVK